MCQSSINTNNKTRRSQSNQARQLDTLGPAVLTSPARYFAPDQATRPGSSDAALSAFAQLAALRLNGTHALISLVDRVNQYILTEVTQTSGLLSGATQDGDDELLFGATTLPRSLGLCGSALEVLSAQDDGPRQRSWRVVPLIVNDLAEDHEFKTHPFVVTHPSVRFFAAMPITTKSGFNIGTLSVLGDEPRQGLSKAETKFLLDLSLTIMAHLVMTRADESHRRSEKMIKGLAVFIEGRTDLDDWWLGLGSNKPRSQSPQRASRPQPQPQQHMPQQSSSQEVLAAAEDTNGDMVNGDLAGHSLVSAPVEPVKADVADAPSPAEAEILPQETPGAGRQVQVSPSRSPPGDVTLISRASNAGRSRRARSYRAGGPRSILSDAEADAQIRSPRPTRGPSVESFAADFHESLISKRLKEMFSRASHIIQECIEVDGAVFLDAAVSTQSGQSADENASEPGESEESSLEASSESASSNHSVEGFGEKENRPAKEFAEPVKEDHETKPCRVLGLWTGEHSSLRGRKVSTLIPLTESFLQRLLQKYPQGHVFSADEGRHVMSNNHTEDSDGGQGTGRSSRKKQKRHPKEPDEYAETKALLGMLPGTRSIAFVPLWDSHRERWFAGSFMWTVQQTRRVLTRTEDLDYLAAFGNSIMAEVARLDVVGADSAKSDFISSISHELRSPLHGILASVEFLQDTAVDMFQHSMVDTIERCGRTLLDTIQHVLDFAKINNFTGSSTREKEKTREAKEAGVPLPPEAENRGLAVNVTGLAVNVDLSLLTEDVVDSVFAGHEFSQGNFSRLVVTGDETGFPKEGLRRTGAHDDGDDPPTPKKTGSKKERIDVVIDIGWRPNWTYNTQSGALRRVLMNLFGNALKYTDSGWVKVSLKAQDIEPTAPLEPEKSIITITVSDSGRGIEQEYLHSRLFTPFTQENHLNPGTGLGLSIVLQIVRSLGGTINITSEQGVGTKVVVTLTLNKAPPGKSPTPGFDVENIIKGAREKTKGLTVGLIGLSSETYVAMKRAAGSKLNPEASKSLEGSIEAAAGHWFDMKVLPASTWKVSPPDIFIANDQRLAQGGAARQNAAIHFVSKPYMIPLSSSTNPLSSPRLDDANPNISYPDRCGPHKLAKAFALFRKSPEEYMSRMGQDTTDDYNFPPTPASRSIDNDIDPLAAMGAIMAAEEITPVPENPKPLLLLVEDNVINLQLLTTFVTKSKYEFATAENGLLALEACQNAKRPFDIIFMDISMPVMDGMAATREIRRLERSRRQKPALIIALTGLGSASSQQEAFVNGVNIFLTKPVRFNALRTILTQWTPDVEVEKSSSVGSSV
ncbi:hypothetical protein B0T24DRAFT_519433 [Lasiosphaeria ovina]|uniref:histidine kinase n=1 Tax=Lasiosphaeria ovina TaxID=92902 RepID=A0AAE0NJE3_9PEZI|nr:hypothetical protein B0T24DRAFT_519433 [Lasiosphaeria ovina]